LAFLITAPDRPRGKLAQRSLGVNKRETRQRTEAVGLRVRAGIQSDCDSDFSKAILSLGLEDFVPQALQLLRYHLRYFDFKIMSLLAENQSDHRSD